ncbi:MAG: alkaline phosphatase D family protein [Pseudomonadales bacterium]
MSAAGRLSRRRWLRLGRDAATMAAVLAASAAPGSVGATRAAAPAGSRPQLPYGLQVGDLKDGGAVLWAAADRPSRLMARWSTRASMTDAVIVPGALLVDATDLTGKLALTGLPPDQRIFVEAQCLDLADYRSTSAPLSASFLTPPAGRRDVRFVWGGDTAGQGWGINPEFGGMRIYETIRAATPDFFIHSGDTVYADGPIQAEVALPGGGVWRNLVTEAKGKVAETLDEFRGQYRYNLMDEPLKRFNAEVPMLAQWDDHEVTNNWYWEMRLDADARYREGSVALLAARAMRAFHEYLPVRRHPLDPDRIFERFPYGPHLEVFRIDLRSYRGPNSDAQPTTLTPEFRILGSAQLDWLKRALADSTATWKVIASDMPLGLIVHDDFVRQRGAEAIALRDGLPAGRELEIAELLTFIRDREVRNVVWLTADVHYAAAHHYDPARARYPHFAPFWEFVAGPLHAGTFGPGRLDDTFGPEAVFAKAPPAGQINLPPSAGMQFFGQVDIEGASGVMTVRLKDLSGETLFTKALTPD